MDTTTIPITTLNMSNRGQAPFYTRGGQDDKEDYMQIEKIGDRSLVNIFGQRDYHTNTESFKKTLFVTQLGELLHDMGIGIDGAKLKDNDTLTVIYKSGREKDVNIAMDSNSAIVYDVFRQCKIFDF